MTAKEALAIRDYVIREKITREKRPTDLLKEPSSTSAGWYMCVPSCFNDGLDVRQIDEGGDSGNDAKLALSTFTIAMWMKWESNHPSHKYRALVSKGPGGAGFLNNYMICVMNSSQIYSRLGHGTSETNLAGVNVGDDEWRHAAFTFDSATGIAVLYIDGEIIAAEYKCKDPYLDGSNLYIGRWSYANSRPYGEFHGAMHLFELYDRALTEAQVQILSSRK